MVKQALTDEQRQRVTDYLNSKGTYPATNDLFYCEDDLGNIVGAYGLEVKVCIEPLQADNKFVSNRLLTDAIATARTSGCEKVHFFTTEPKAVKHLETHERAVKWGSKLTELFIYFKNK